MSELILHHYPMSPFAEKVRLILGYKQLPWRSVIIPPVMPKPDVVALTGGYRKTPDPAGRRRRVLRHRADRARARRAATGPDAVPGAGTAGRGAGAVGRRHACSAQPSAGPCSRLAWPPSWVQQPPEVLKAFAADRAAMRANAPRPDAGRRHGAAEAAPLGHRRATAAGRALAVRHGTEHRRLLASATACGSSAWRGPWRSCWTTTRRSARGSTGCSPSAMPRPRRWTAAKRWRVAAAALAHAPATVDAGPGLRGRAGRHRGGHRLRRRPGGRHPGGAEPARGGAAPHRRAGRHGARAFPALRFPDQADKT